MTVTINDLQGMVAIDRGVLALLLAGCLLGVVGGFWALISALLERVGKLR